MTAKKAVAILGGGVGGLGAAHELAERGFAVTVYRGALRLGQDHRPNRQTVFRRLQRVDQQFKLTMTASNLMRIARMPSAVPCGAMR